MALPKKGDPRRPLFMAIRSCQLLGLIFVLLTLIVGIGLVMQPGSARIALAVGVLMLPGILYMMTAVFLKQRREWAIVMGLVVASLHALLALVAFIGSLLGLPASLVATVVTGLWVLALLQLIQHLTQSKAAMRADADIQQRGFEVLPLPVQPVDDQAD